MAGKTRNAPVLDLDEAVGLLGRLRETVGFSPASRELLAEALGHSSLSGPASRKIAALNHYDLIDRESNGGYQITELGKSVLMPTSEEERKRAVATAAVSPSFYEELMDRFGDSVLPSMLPNILTRDFGVHPNSGDAFAEVFRSTMTYAGLLRNGVLHTEPEHEDAKVKAGALGTEPAAQSVATPTPPPKAPSPSTGDAQIFTVPLDTKGRVAHVTIPTPFTDADLTSLELWVGYIRGVSKRNGPASASD